MAVLSSPFVAVHARLGEGVGASRDSLHPSSRTRRSFGDDKTSFFRRETIYAMLGQFVAVGRVTAVYPEKGKH